MPFSFHGEFPDLPIGFWRIGENVVRDIYDKKTNPKSKFGFID